MHAEADFGPPVDIASERIGPELIPSACGSLDDPEIECLWELFQQIGRTWNNVAGDSAGQRSSWLEFLALRCTVDPSYLGEYRNAVQITNAYVDQLGLIDGYRRLLVDKQLCVEAAKQANVETRLHHVKHYVVNEFIHVQIVTGGFRGFGGENRAYNYNGFVRGTRYNRTHTVRDYRAV